MNKHNKFDIRLDPEDRQRLDTLAAAAGKTRAGVIKEWLRNAEPGGGPSDSVARVTVSEADTLAMSDQL